MIETIILEISSYCNGSCITCLNRVMKQKKGFMDFDLFKSLIDQIVNERLCECVNLFGVGESFLHPHHMDYFNYAIPRLNTVGIKSNIITNGELVDEIPEGLTTMGISFNGGKKESFERITNLPFEKTVRNIRRLIDEGQHLKTNFGINMLVCEDNQGEEDDLRNLFPDVPIRYAYKVENQCGVIADKTLPEYQTTERFPCRYVLNDVNIASSGDVLLCPHSFNGEVIYGNVRESSIKTVWESDIHQKWIADHMNHQFKGICSNCNYNISFEDKYIFVNSNLGDKEN